MSLWRHIEAVSRVMWNSTGVSDNANAKGVGSPLEDWSFAVAQALRQRYAATGDESLRGFKVKTEVHITQPTVSRVWHIGKDSSIAQDETQREGWPVTGFPPWHEHVPESARDFDYSRRPGTFDYMGRNCAPKPEPPCDATKTIETCAEWPSVFFPNQNLERIKTCENVCLPKLRVCEAQEDAQVKEWLGPERERHAALLIQSCKPVLAARVRAGCCHGRPICNNNK